MSAPRHVGYPSAQALPGFTPVTYWYHAIYGTTNVLPTNHFSRRDEIETDMFELKPFFLSQEGYEDPHKTLPSVVIHVRGLIDGVTEADLVEALQEFGPIR